MGCRAKQYKDKSLAQLGQKVQCDPKVGLICKGKDQGIPPICFDYEIRVRCLIDTCKPSVSTTAATTIKETTTEKPAKTTEKPEITTKEKPTTTTKATTEKPIKTTEHPTTTKEKPTVKTTEKPTTTTTIVPTTTTVQPTTSCHVYKWSEWTNNHYPTSGDDTESIKDIKNLDLSACTKPLETECRAKQYKDKSLAQLGQKVQCDPTVGLICKGKDQGIPPICFDYEIRVRCLIDTCKPSVSTTAATTIKETTTEKPAKTTEKPEITTKEKPTTTTKATTEKPIKTTEHPTTTKEKSTV